ncbi:RNA polymerase sigma factor, partial [Streptomyces toxytricini]|uniref:RNA polymerase sigma factor n=1 Tax=Streptomyces toxytricini TaxID=67369 RepID=UPI003421C0B9
MQDDAARALAELYRRHRAAVLAYARRFASAHTADDLASEAFTRTLHAVRQGAGPTGSWRPYLCVVVRNTAAQDAKAQRVHGQFADFEAWSESLPDTTEPERTLLRNEETLLLIRSFRSLPERWQAVLWHRLVDERATAEVAQLLGLTPSGVSTLLARAQEGLRTAYLQAHIREGGDAECQHYAGLMGSVVRNRGTRHRGLVRHLDGCDRCSTAFADIEHLNARLRALAPFALLLGWGSTDLSGSTPSGSSSAATKASGGSIAPDAGWMAAHPWLLSLTAAATAATAASVIAFTGSGLTTATNPQAAPLSAVSPTTAPIAGALFPAGTTAAAQEPTAQPSQASVTPKPSPSRPTSAAPAPSRSAAPAPSRSAAPAPSRSATDQSAEG